MTHLRKMMLEELQRRNYAETTISSYIRIVEDFRDASNGLLTAWALSTFENINRNYSRSGNSLRAPSRYISRLCGSSTPRRSRGSGAQPRLPIRKG